MKIIRPYAKLVNVELINLQSIEYAGRISHRSEEEMKQDSFEKFIKAVVVGHGDWSITEHAVAQVEMVVDRGITHEIVRHRIGSYTQESTRFVNYDKVYPVGHPQAGQYKNPASFIYPKTDSECVHCLSGFEPLKTPHGWFHDFEKGGIRCEYESEWLSTIYSAERGYKNLLNYGWRPQEARSVLPNALSSKIFMTYNLRTWRHFFIMRTTKETHPQFRQVSIPLLEEFKKIVPLLYDDIGPNARQIDNLRLPE